jgi:hypothetical protein
MKTIFFIAGVLASSLFAGAALAREVKDVIPDVLEAASNPVIIKAVKEQNAKDIPLTRILQINKSWIDTTNSNKEPTEFMKSFVANAAAKALTKIEFRKPYLGEFILTDNQGANVALTGITSGYWQGDEPKFTDAYANGKGNIYIARPQKDKSTGETISQVSVPVMSDGKAIGTLTVGVRLGREYPQNFQLNASLSW